MYEIVTKTLPFAVLSMEFVSAGEDWQVLFQGGDRPHIGCTVLAQPRPSLTRKRGDQLHGFCDQSKRT